MTRYCAKCNTPLRDGSDFCSTCHRILKKTEMRIGPNLPEKARKTLLQLGAGIAFVLFSFWTEIRDLFTGRNLDRVLPFLIIALLFIIAIVVQLLRTDRVSEAEARARKERGRPSARKTRFEEWVKAHTEQDQSTGPTGF
jgi:hypothetical protein